MTLERYDVCTFEMRCAMEVVTINLDLRGVFSMMPFPGAPKGPRNENFKHVPHLGF